MERRTHLIAPILLTIAVLAVEGLALSRDRLLLVESLKRLSPIFLGVTFFALIILGIVSADKIFAPFTALPRRSLAILGLVAVLAFGLVFFVAPRTHRIYYDESIDLNIGQSIAYTGRAQMINFAEIRSGELNVRQGEYNKQPNSYPFLLSLVYRLFGCSEGLSFLFNNLVFVLTALTIFGIAQTAFGDFKTGVYASLLWIVIPQNILWHNTTSVEASNTLFLALAFFLALRAARAGSLRLYYLAAVAGCFAAQFRMESFLILPLLLIVAALGDRQAFGERKLYYAVPLVLALLGAHAIHLYCFSDHAWGAVATQKTFSLSYIGHNLMTNGGFLLDGKGFPVLLTLFAVLGLLAKRFVPERLMLLGWFALFWGIFLPFYAGSYSYGADVRFSLMAFPPLAVLAARGLAVLDEAAKRYLKVAAPLAASLIVVAFLAYAPKARTVGQEAWAARADHFYAREMLKAVPDNGLIFTHNPSMFLFWGRSAAQASNLGAYDEIGLRGLRDNFPGGLYFHFNFWCNVSDPLQRSFCQSILERFRHEEVVSYRERDYTYVLYRLYEIKGSDASGPSGDPAGSRAPGSPITSPGGQP